VRVFVAATWSWTRSARLPWSASTQAVWSLSWMLTSRERETLVSLPVPGWPKRVFHGHPDSWRRVGGRSSKRGAHSECSAPSNCWQERDAQRQHDPCGERRPTSRKKAPRLRAAGVISPSAVVPSPWCSRSTASAASLRVTRSGQRGQLHASAACPLRESDCSTARRRLLPVTGWPGRRSRPMGLD